MKSRSLAQSLRIVHGTGTGRPHARLVQAQILYPRSGGFLWRATSGKTHLSRQSARTESLLAILSSTRNLLIFGGLGVFALGWGGGLLLGAFSSPDDEPADTQPQLVDADEYSPSEGREKEEEKSSSLLEQVFGLDDLEEEKPPPPKKPRGNSATAALPSAPSAPPQSQEDLADKLMRGEVEQGETVQLEEALVPPNDKAPPADHEQKDNLATAPTEAPAPEAKPPKSIFDENPYK